jgi:hypothetical protein
MEVVLRLIELKPGSRDRVVAWAEYVNAHRARAIDSIKAEGVLVETWFSLSLGEKDYLLCYMRAKSMEEAQKVAAMSDNPIDAYHHQFKVDTWIRGAGAVGELLVDLSRGEDQ